MSTNITDQHREAFEALTSGEHSNFALFSCFVGGEPASAIVAVNQRRRRLHHHAALRQRYLLNGPCRP